MKYALLGLCAAIALTTTTAAYSADKQPVFYSSFKNEAVALALPGWTMANQLIAPERALLQFLPPGADPKKAETLVNVVSYLGLNNRTDALTFAKNEQSKAPKLASPGKIDFKFIDQSNAKDVVYSIALSGNPKYPDQFEVHRVLVGKDGLHTIIYHVQPASQSDSRVSEMVQVVKSVQLVPPPKKAE